jgi:hypothetical protein
VLYFLTHGNDFHRIIISPCRKGKVLSAALCAGFYPQLARVLKPPKRFVETVGGSVEKMAEARELKLYIPEKPDEGFELSKGTDDNADTRGEPKSILFVYITCVSMLLFS